MIALSAIGVDINIFLLLFFGLAVGIIGGGYMVTPLLVVIGFSKYAAAGIGITHIIGKPATATTTHLHREGKREKVT